MSKRKALRVSSSWASSLSSHQTPKMDFLLHVAIWALLLIQADSTLDGTSPSSVDHNTNPSGSLSHTEGQPSAPLPPSAPNGTLRAPNGTLRALNGSSSASNGTSSDPNRNSSGPNGTSSTSNGTSTTSNGTSSTSNGTLNAPNGTSSTPKGTSTTPKGTSSTPKGTSSTPKGTSMTPKGTSSTPITNHDVVVRKQPAVDPGLTAGLVSAFVIAAVVLSLLVFLKMRRRNARPQFRRLADLPMDDLMEDAPLSMYSY